jgi:hypothetical protein
MHVVGARKGNDPARGACTGAAWLSSARVVRCWVKSRNERNPCVLLPPGRKTGALWTDCLASTRRKVGMTSSQYGPYGQGCTRTTMPGTMGRKTARWSKSPKTGPSSDCRLQLAGMKLESLVMAHQLRRREYVPRPCTHRPSHHESRLYPKSPSPGAEGMAGDWGEVVTR